MHTLQCLADFAVNCGPYGKSLFRNSVLDHMLLGKLLACGANPDPVGNTIPTPSYLQ